MKIFTFQFWQDAFGSCMALVGFIVLLCFGLPFWNVDFYNSTRFNNVVGWLLVIFAILQTGYLNCAYWGDSPKVRKIPLWGITSVTMCLLGAIYFLY